MIIFVVLWQAGPLFGQPGPAGTAPRGLWDQEQSLLSPSPGLVILDEVIDPSHFGRGFGLGTDQLSAVRAQRSGQAGQGAR